MIDEHYDEYYRNEMIVKFEKNFKELVKVKGVIRDFVFRVLSKQHSIWWQGDMSPYKVNLWHSPVPEGYNKPTAYMDRALDLCEYEMTHDNYGLTFKDLMELDLTTFEEIEQRVHEQAKARQGKIEQLTSFEDVEKKSKKQHG